MESPNAQPDCKGTMTNQIMPIGTTATGRSRSLRFLAACLLVALVAAGTNQACHPRSHEPRLPAIFRQRSQSARPHSRNRITYLIDLYDYARLMQDETAWLALLKNLRMTRNSTQRDVLDAMAAETRSLPPRDATFARQALSLLLLDQSRLVRPWNFDAMRHRANTLFALIPTRVGVNAALRLYVWCGQALRAALESSPWNRPHMLTSCPLGWQDLNHHATIPWHGIRHRGTANGRLQTIMSRMHQTLAFVSRTSSCLAPVARRLAKQAQTLRPAILRRLDDHPDDWLPRVRRAPPLPSLPLLKLDGSAITWKGRRFPTDKGTLRRLLTKILESNPSRRLLIAAPARLPFRTVWPIVKEAVYTGFGAIDLVVAIQENRPKKRRSTRQSRRADQATEGPTPRTGTKIGAIPILLGIIAPWPKPPPARFFRHTCSRPPKLPVWNSKDRYLTVVLSQEGVLFNDGQTCTQVLAFPGAPSLHKTAPKSQPSSDHGNNADAPTGDSAPTHRTSTQSPDHDLDTYHVTHPRAPLRPKDITKVERALSDWRHRFPRQRGILIFLSDEIPMAVVAQVLAAATKTKRGTGWTIALRTDRPTCPPPAPQLPTPSAPSNTTPAQHPNQPSGITRPTGP
ncbi:MAG: hypothetical protein J7M25_08965 [Deltaproteobacteria bacterium]|nr:hypothetical protein [Deltaproteobacteria bacterium]